MNRLMEVTEELLQQNEMMLDFYEERMEHAKNRDYFFDTVKPFADKVKALADEWFSLASEWVKKEQPVYLHLKQLEDTHENMTIASVTCFQPDTKEKRFKEMNQSIHYVLRSLESAWKEKESRG